MIAPRSRFSLPLPGRPSLELGARTLVMGVLNITPDSFSDGGLAFDPARATELGLAMQEAGADIIDIGAESTRPGAVAIDDEEEWRRLRPVMKSLPHRLRIPVSVDTYKAAVARRALDEGVAIVNDISALGYDPGLGAVVAGRGAALVLMHTRGRPETMYAEARYDDVPDDVARELQRSVERAIGHGVPWERLMLDPGLGFANRAEHSLSALAGLDRIGRLGRPVLVGPSRKSFLAPAVGRREAADRDWPTTAAITAAILAGAHIVRVHRVAEMVQVARAADAIRSAGRER